LRVDLARRNEPSTTSPLPDRESRHSPGIWARSCAKPKEMTDAPVAVITNSTLLSSPGVRREIAAADVVLPSLDAATEESFWAVNRPASGLKIENIIQGLKDFRKEF